MINGQFKEFDIPVLCSVFMPAAFEYHAGYLVPVDIEIKDYYKQWNRVLQEVLKKDCFKKYRGKHTEILLRAKNQLDSFLNKCVMSPSDIGVQSLYNAIRNTETLNYLSNKQKEQNNLKFVDLGCGFSPMAAAFQTKYNIKNAYIIDKEPIADAYIQTAELVGGRTPEFKTWSQVKNMALKNEVNTITAMGVLPHMPIKEQVSKLDFINQHFSNFFLEIMYTINPERAERFAFTPEGLARLRMTVEHSKDIETTLIHNSLRYYKRMCNLKKQYFLHNERSLFVSR